jgi:predicted restriction endonuclease
MDDLTTYCEAFSSLRRQRSQGVWLDKSEWAAPHKPLLLLSVIDLFAKGELRSAFIALNSDLEKQFASYWALVTDREYADDIVHPFFALKNESVGFWVLVARPGKTELLRTKRDWVRLSLDHLRQCISGARIHKNLCKLLLIEESRLILRQVLVEKYFSPAATLQLAGVTLYPRPQYTEAARKQSTLNRILRDSAAAIFIKRLYDFRCQICHTRLTVGNQPYAEAAHIKPLGTPHKGPDHSANLLCLCPNHHVLFDLGGIAITDGFEIIPGGKSLVVHPTHIIELDFVRYHRNEICGRLKGPRRRLS